MSYYFWLGADAERQYATGGRWPLGDAACMIDKSVSYPPIDRKDREEALRRYMGFPMARLTTEQIRLMRADIASRTID